MFRDDDARTLVISLIIATLFMGAATWYEIAYRTKDSWLETITSIAMWIGPSLGLTIFIMAYREAAKMIAEKYKARRYNEGIESADVEWAAWLERRDQAFAEGREFTEPNPREARQARKHNGSNSGR